MIIIEELNLKHWYLLVLVSPLGTVIQPGDGICLYEFQEVMSNEDQIKGSGDI